MKKLVLATMAITMMSGTAAHAGYCDQKQMLPYALIMSGISSFTGTTMLKLDKECSEEILLLQEDAFNYKMTGKKSTTLEETMNTISSLNPNLSESEIVQKLIEAKTN